MDTQLATVEEDLEGDWMTSGIFHTLDASAIDSTPSASIPPVVPDIPSTTTSETNENNSGITNDERLRAPPSTSFRESKVSIAVDVSSSTQGSVLEMEKRVIRNISSLIPRRLRSDIKILPWNHSAYLPCTLTQLESLYAEGGTDPNIFLHEPECRDVLQDSSFWFLMTDGEIDEASVRRFARGLVEYGLHGKACIITIFGEREECPADCNISVGLSVFAVSPHVAFLYTDVATQNTYVLQTKGCFSAILPRNVSNPTLVNSTTWEHLPLTSFENLSRVSVPPSQILGKDELLLPNNSRVNISDFLNDLPDDDKAIGQILDSDDNLKTIVLTTKLRDQGAKLRSWLDHVDEKLERQAKAEMEEVEKQSQAASDAMEEIIRATDLSQVVLAREKLQRANEEAASRRHSLAGFSQRRRSSGLARRMSTGGLDTAGDNLSVIDSQPPPLLPPLPPPQPRPHPPHPRNLGRYPSTTSKQHGFHGSNRQDEVFKGVCMVCLSAESILGLLLRSPPAKTTTANFPAKRTFSRLLYPLTVGNYAETDIIASVICCGKCSARLVQAGETPSGDRLISALPLQSFLTNTAVWLQILHQATLWRFHGTQLPIVFLAILCTKLERLLEEGGESPRFYNLREGIKWTCNMLLSEVIVSPASASGINSLGTGALYDTLLQSFKNTIDNTKSTRLLEYPLDGFIVANIALSNSARIKTISGNKRKNIVFLRFLYHLTERYHQYAKEHDELVLRAAKSLTLLVDDPAGRKSLFGWQYIRQLSVRFKDFKDMRKFFSTTSSYKLSLAIKELLETPFLEKQVLINFERLGVLFNWISSQAGHATAVFLHHLLRMDISATSTQERFSKVWEQLEVQEALRDPADTSAKKVEELTRLLPAL
jgi:hypothetical protein